MRRAHPERALENHLEAQSIAPDGATVVVACSGGPDSVALASLLARLAPAHRWKVVLAHVNHRVRASSWQDECIVLSIAARLALPVRIAALQPQGLSEATLRKQRYAALGAIAKDVGAACVVTAHTAEDQTETVMLALFRGTGPGGLAGIPPRRRLQGGIELVRPLLRIGRETLGTERGASALPYVRDPTNLDLAYRRNAVRSALEGLRRQFPRLDEAVARCAEILGDELAHSDRATARRRLRDALAGLGEDEVGLRDVSFERIEAALRARRGRVHLKKGVEVVTGERRANSRVIRRKD